MSTKIDYNGLDEIVKTFTGEGHLMQRIVILGAGYAGLSFARNFHSDQAHVTLVDQNPYHTVLVELHRLASGSQEAHDLKIALDSLDGFVQAKVTKIDRENKKVLTDEGELPYDYLIFALGGVDSDWGIPGVREHAHTLRSVDDALAIRQAVAALPADGAITIIGGGLTGCELAAELGERVTLIQAGDHLLSGFPRRLQRAAQRRLESLGVKVLTGSPVVGVEADRVITKNGPVASDLTVWAAGVTGHPLLPVATTRGRATVDAHFLSEDPSIYVIGDSAYHELPPSGQLAEAAGKIAADHLMARLEGRTVAPQTPKLKGTLVDLGGPYGLAHVFGFSLTGLLPVIMKRFVGLRHILTVRRQQRRRLNLVTGLDSPSSVSH